MRRGELIFIIGKVSGFCVLSSRVGACRLLAEISCSSHDRGTSKFPQQAAYRQSNSVYMISSPEIGTGSNPAAPAAGCAAEADLTNRLVCAREGPSRVTASTYFALALHSSAPLLFAPDFFCAADSGKQLHYRGCAATHSRASFCASATCAGVIRLATMSRSLAAISLPLETARLYHLCA